MIVGQRIEACLKVKRLSQSELARRVGLNQSTIHGLISGEQRSTTKLHLIARELGTTPAYLEGEIDDPHENAPPPPPPALNRILLEVILPSELALAQMFEGMLEVAHRDAPLDALARELAEMLPTALSALRGPLKERAASVPAAPATPAEALATADRESPR